MQNHIKYLVIEDQPAWSEGISTAVRSYFQDKKGFVKDRVRDFSALNARQANQQIEAGGWDLVMLDMNLGEGSDMGKVSGLDLHGKIAASNKAYFVIIITGAVNDPTLERVYGPETAAMLRFGALNEAVKLMSASRVRILHKPSCDTPRESLETLRPHLESALDQYCSVSLERNIFRPLPGDPGLWEVCYNGGPRITLKHIESYKMIRSALAQPNRALKIIQLVQALAQSSGKAGATVPVEAEKKEHRKVSKNLEYKGHQEDEVNEVEGLDWSEMNGYNVSDHSPVDADDGALDREVLLGGLLLAQAQNLDLSAVIKHYAEAYGETVLLSLPSKALDWASRPGDARRQFSAEDAPAELASLARVLKSLLAPLRGRWLEAKGNMAGDGMSKKTASGKIRVAKGVETPQFALARQHWNRFKLAIGKRPALKTFREHMIQWVDRSPTAKGHLHYRPPGGEDLCPFWLTE